MNEITRHLKQTARLGSPVSRGAAEGESAMIRKVIWNAIGFVLFVGGSLYFVGAWIETLKMAVL